MLFSITRNRRRDLEQEKKFINSFAGGVGQFSPGNLVNLQNWFKPAGISCPAGNTNDWLDSQQSGEKMTGVSCISGTSCNCIGALNSKQFLISDTNAASLMGYTDPTKANHIGSYTVGGILSSQGALSGVCWNNRTDVGSTLMALQQDGAGKLVYFVRSTNGQTANPVSTTVWNGNGWKIFLATFDYVAKTSTLYEGGNTIPVTNALMDNFVYATPAFYMNGANGGVSKWLGNIGEFFIYTDVKTTAQINRLGNYLAGQYILTWTDV